MSLVSLEIRNIFPDPDDSDPVLVGHTIPYGNYHGDDLPSFLQAGVGKERFDRIVAEIVDIFQTTLQGDPSGITRSLRSTAGLSLSLDSLKNPFGLAHSSTLADLPLPDHQKQYADKRNQYLQLLESFLAGTLVSSCRDLALQSSERLIVSIGSHPQSGVLSAKFKIVSVQKQA